MTTSFFAPPQSFSGASVVLPPEEAHHASRVIRHRVGDVVRVFDGTGTAYQVMLTAVDGDLVRGDIVERRPRENEPDYRLNLAVGLLKQRARFETLVEKAVELGVSTVVPLLTRRTEKGGFRSDRMTKIVLAAAKQCGRSVIPVIQDPISLDEYLRNDASALRLICHEAAEDAPSIMSLLTYEPSAEISIMIGPEGGFDENEIAAARESGWMVAHLGPRRLRAETAGVVAASACVIAGFINTDST